MFSWVWDAIKTVCEFSVNLTIWIYYFFVAIFGWLFKHLFALVALIFASFSALISWFLRWVGNLIGSVGSINQPDHSFAESVNALIRSCFAEGGWLGQIAGWFFDVINVGAFINYWLLIALPMLIAAVTYRVVKTWIPTVSS